ncbi:hypothetical protein E2I00_000329 [Balaenoptera physalus]|uniref:Neutrophil cytosol factor 1 n=1 Tax=Balaenoptera physalus TaxID=9770 RepID=A0A643C750_BALPH|nr:hypothetical protein E2I00_000329 [Balaenoptera physalus]
MGDPFIRHIALLGFEKRFVYMFLVKWQDLSEKVVYRRFTEIYEFHKILKEMFPIEAGDITPENRIIPHLPAPRWFDGQRVAESRQGTLTEYCNSLMNLPGKISRCPHLLNFFKSGCYLLSAEAPISHVPSGNFLGKVKKPETYLMPRDGKSNAADITGPIILQTYRVIADYEKSSGSEMALATGDVVDVVEKSQSGWWFCQMKRKRGWVPASYLEPLDSPDEVEDPEPNYAGEPYVTIKAYTALLEDEMSLEQGETIEVIHKLLDGWWVISQPGLGLGLRRLSADLTSTSAQVHQQLASPDFRCEPVHPSFTSQEVSL